VTPDQEPAYPVQGGAGAPAPHSPPAAPGASDPRKQLLELLRAAQDKHFVFMFGPPSAGKTVVLGSMLQAMQRPEVNGRLFIHGAGDGYFKYGLSLWSQIRTAFEQQRFPRRTEQGKTIQLHAQYRPSNSEPPLDIVFLEMSGEDLKTVHVTVEADGEGRRDLPFHIEQFLRVPNLKLAFIIVTSWEAAEKDDALINDFLAYINEKAPHLSENRFIILVTKWDTKPGDPNEPIYDFIRARMPATANKIAAKRNIVQPFSVGTIVPFAGPDGDIIANFDHAAGQRLFARLYETFTGVPTEPKKSWFGSLFG
jgi:hypothetical protein